MHLSHSLDARIIAVMVNWNGKMFLHASIPSVIAELSGVNGQLLLVDNASTDGSVEYVQQHFPEVVILQMGENLGGAGGFSAGMRASLECAKCEFVWLLDNDILAESGALPPLLNYLDSDPSAGAAGSQICLYDKPETIQEIGANLTPWLGGLQQCFSGQVRLATTTSAFRVDYLAACSILIRRCCLEQIGVFGDFFIFYDDVEWGVRAQRAGWSLWGVPTSVIRHNYNATKPTTAWREYYRKRNRLALLTAYPPRLGGIFASFIYLFYLNQQIQFHKWREEQDLYRALLWARQDGLIGRFGKRDLSDFVADTKQLNTDSLLGLTEILVDIGENAGDTFYLIDCIHQQKPAICFFLPKHLEKYLNLVDRSYARLGTQSCYQALIIGRKFNFGSLRRAERIFGYRNGILIQLSTLDLLKDLAIRLASFFPSLFLAPMHWLILLWRRQKITNSF